MTATVGRSIPHGKAARRHQALLAAALIGLLALACAPGQEAGDPPASPEGDEPRTNTTGAAWTFTDDRGVTHTLPEVPTTIAAQSVAAGGLWDYGIEVDGVFGPLRRSDGSPDPAVGLADPDAFTSLGEIDSEINLEALAALQPDIIVTSMWDEETYWGIDDELDELEQIAPIVGIRVDDRPVTEPLARYGELAESLGAEPGLVAEARGRFDEASTALTDAIGDNPGLTVVAASGTPSEMYIAYPPGFPDLAYFQELGMDLVVPESHPTSGGFWETLSWEEAGKYPADLILADARGGTVPQILDQLPGPALALPAIEADQLISWETVHAYGYENFAAILDELADEVHDASAEIVP